MKLNLTKLKPSTWYIALLLIIIPMSVYAADEQEYQRIEPNEYVQKQIEMNLSIYAEQNNRSASSLSEEQLLLTFQQIEQQEEDDLFAELFTNPFAGQASLLNEVERFDLFAESFQTRSASTDAEGSTSVLSLTTLFIGVVIGLVILLFIWLIPKLNEEVK